MHIIVKIRMWLKIIPKVLSKTKKKTVITNEAATNSRIRYTGLI